MHHERNEADVTHKAQEAKDAGKGHDIPLARQHTYAVREEGLRDDVRAMR
jgi:hypothetical protein